MESPLDIDIQDEPIQETPRPDKGRKPVPSVRTVMKDEDRFRLAVRLFRGKDRLKRYPDIVELLRPYVENRPDHLTAMKLLAYALVETGATRDAVHYYRKVLSANKNDTEALNASAFLELETGNAEDAVQMLLDAVYVDERDERLKANLEKLRNIRDPKLFFSMTRPSDFLFYNLPEENSFDRFRSAALDGVGRLALSKTGRVLLLISGIAVLGALLYFFYPAIRTLAEDYRLRRGLGAHYRRISIRDIDKLVEDRVKYSIKLTEEQIQRKFAMIREALEARQRNRALMLVNELLHSNASELIKERVRMLQGFVQNPDPREIDFTPDIREVVKLPFLYEGVAVRWSGTVANLEFKGRDETAFDLLINFVDRATVDGIAEIHFKGFRKVSSGQKAAVFGVITGLTLDNRVIVRGLEIQDLGR